jgi:hypothetical protein
MRPPSRFAVVRAGSARLPLAAPLEPDARRSAVQLFWECFWWTWILMLIVGDPIANWVFGEQASDTHFLVTHVSVSLRVPIIAWVAWHFLVAHPRS